MPTLILLDPSGCELGRITGIVQRGDLAAWIASRGERKPETVGRFGSLG